MRIFSIHLLLFVVFILSSCRENNMIVTLTPEAGTIAFSPGTSPGFLEVADNTTAFTANYSGTVSRVNLLSNSVVTTSGHVVAFPGGIVTASGKVYVSDYGLYPNYKNIVIVLDATTLNVLDTIDVGVAAGMMVKDSSGFVCIVCAGSYPSKGKVYTINTVTDAVVDSVEVGSSPSDIAMRNHLLYVLHGDRVMKLTISPLSVVDTLFVSLSSGLYFYAMNVDVSTGNVYVSKIVSSGGSGEVEIHTPSGALKRPPFAVGIFPGAFAFKQSSDHGVFIINEGSYPNAGTVSYYSVAKDSLVGNIIGVSAGWITPNDAKVVGTKVYIVVNGNDKIEILNTEAFQ